MSAFADVVLLICADTAHTKSLVAGLSASREYVQVPLATCVDQARRMLERLSPDVILLDASALNLHLPNDWESIVTGLAERAPVVLATAPLRHSALASLARSGVVALGAVALVDRSGNFAEIVSELIERRARQSPHLLSSLDTASRVDFGEILRHEMNNPLTGILGNAELLLAKRERLPLQAVVQLQTIAELAMRLRETVQRLSETWESTRHHAHTI